LCWCVVVHVWASVYVGVCVWVHLPDEGRNWW
jgi:hypothetical protein